MKIESIESLFEENLKDLYDAEKQMVRALPKLAKAATFEDLTQVFLEHLAVTKTHIDRLEKVFELVSAKPKSKTCEGMKGLVVEGQEAIEQEGDDSLRDMMLIGAAKRVEHYEMGGYQAAILLAEALSNEEAADLLRQTLAEEEEADGILGGLCVQLTKTYASEPHPEADSDQKGRARESTRTRTAGAR